MKTGNKSGFAMGLALLALVIVSSIVAFAFKTSLSSNKAAANEAGSKMMEQKAQSAFEAASAHLEGIVQTALKQNSGTNFADVLAQTRWPQPEGLTNVSVTCIENCNTNSTYPKRFVIQLDLPNASGSGLSAQASGVVEFSPSNSTMGSTAGSSLASTFQNLATSAPIHSEAGSGTGTLSTDCSTSGCCGVSYSYNYAHIYFSDNCGGNSTEPCDMEIDENTTYYDSGSGALTTKGCLVYSSQIARNRGQTLPESLVINLQSPLVYLIPYRASGLESLTGYDVVHNDYSSPSDPSNYSVGYSRLPIGFYGPQSLTIISNGTFVPVGSIMSAASTGGGAQATLALVSLGATPAITFQGNSTGMQGSSSQLTTSTYIFANAGSLLPAPGATPIPGYWNNYVLPPTNDSEVRTNNDYLATLTPSSSAGFFFQRYGCLGDTNAGTYTPTADLTLGNDPACNDCGYDNCQTLGSIGAASTPLVSATTESVRLEASIIATGANQPAIFLKPDLLVQPSNPLGTLHIIGAVSADVNPIFNISDTNGNILAGFSRIVVDVPPGWKSSPPPGLSNLNTGASVDLVASTVSGLYAKANSIADALADAGLTWQSASDANLSPTTYP